MTGIQKSLFLALFLSSPAFSAQLPVAIEKQLPQGFSTLFFQTGDLNDDGLSDYIVVAYKKDEKQIDESGGDTPGRPLLIFVQRKDGKYILAARNDDVVSPIDSGGPCDQILDSGEDAVAVKGTYLTIQNGVACGQHWTDYITFKYVKSLNNWIFHRRIFEEWVMNKSHKPNADVLVRRSRSVKSADSSKPILLSNYHQ